MQMSSQGVVQDPEKIIQYAVAGELMVANKSKTGFRSLLIGSYEIPRYFYVALKGTAAKHLSDFGFLTYYGTKVHVGRGHRKVTVDVDAMVKKWHSAVLGLAVAHDKDEADRYEASIEEILLPMLSCPVKQLREFAPKLVTSLRSDPKVPFLVWRSYEAWVENVLDKAPDEGVKELKVQLAKEITELVEQDVKEQLPEAIVKALMWRCPETLEKVKEVVTAEKEKGNKVRLKGRESCLFIEAGGTEAEPDICIQV